MREMKPIRYGRLARIILGYGVVLIFAPRLLDANCVVRFGEFIGLSLILLVQLDASLFRRK